MRKQKKFFYTIGISIWKKNCNIIMIFCVLLSLFIIICEEISVCCFFKHILNATQRKNNKLNPIDRDETAIQWWASNLSNALVANLVVYTYIYLLNSVQEAKTFFCFMSILYFSTSVDRIVCTKKMICEHIKKNGEIILHTFSSGYL